MPDVQIHPTGTVATPADYVIPSGAELMLKGVFAHFDGSAAAGSFQPLVRIISDGGTTTLEAVSDTTVAAGGSADASWFPHIAAAPAAAPSGTTAVVAYGTNFNGQTVPAGTSANSSFANAVHSSDTSKLTWTTTTVLNDTLTIHGTGFAMLTAGCSWPAGTKIDYRIFSPNGFEVFPHDGFDSMSGYDTSLPPNLATLMDVSWIDTTGPTTPLRVRMTNSDAANSGPDLAYIGCVLFPGLT